MVTGKVTDDGRLAIYILLATIPAVAFGLALEKLNVPDLERNVTVVAWNTILYGILMMIADMVGTAGAHHRKHDARQRADDRRGAGARADPGHQPLRRDHDGRPILGLHQARLGALLLPFRYSGDRIGRTVDGARCDGKWPEDHLDEVYCAVFTFVTGMIAIAFLMQS